MSRVLLNWKISLLQLMKTSQHFNTQEKISKIGKCSFFEGGKLGFSLSIPLGVALLQFAIPFHMYSFLIYVEVFELWEFIGDGLSQY